MRGIGVIISDLTSITTRINALEELKEMAKTDINMSEAIDPILSCLDDSDKLVRISAVCALGRIAAKGIVDMSRVVEPLIRMLEDNDKVVKANTAYILGIIAEKGTVYINMNRVVEPLIRRLEDDNEVVRMYAAYTLGSISKKWMVVDMSRAVEPLIRRLEDGNEVVRRNAVSALGRIAVKGIVDMSRAVEPLIKRLDDSDEVVRRNTASALGRMAAKGTVDMSRAVEPLIKRLDDSNELVRRNTASTLGRIATKGIVDISSALEPLIRKLEDSSGLVRRYAIYTLCIITEKGTIDMSRAVEPLIRMLNNDDKYVYIAAVKALSIIAEKSTIDINGEIGGLIYMLQDEEYKQLALFTFSEIVRKEGNYSDMSLLTSKLFERRFVHAAKFCLNELIKRRKVDVNKLEPILYELMKHEDSCINILGAQILVSIGNREEQQHGMDCIMGRLTLSPEAMVYAINALKEVGDSYVMRRLESFKRLNPQFSRLTDECVKEIYQREEILSRVWEGKYGESKFIPTAVNLEGYQVGAIYEKEHTRLDNIGPRKRWIGRASNINRMAVREKISSDIYRVFGVTVPKTRLAANIEEGNKFTYEEGKNVVTFIMSKFIQDYNNLGERFIEEIVKNEGRPPDRIFVYRKELKLRGFMKGLAVGKFLGDIDFLGVEGKNAGFMIKTHDFGEYAEFIKIDTGDAFNFEAFSRIWLESLVSDPETPERKIVNSRNILIGFNSKNIFTGDQFGFYVIFNKLSMEQRNEFIETMEKIAEISDKKIERIVKRAGEFGKAGGGLHKDEEDRIVEQLKGRRDLMKKLYGADIARYKYSRMQNMSRSSEQMVLA